MKSRYLKSQKGTNFIEFAFVLPVFLLMVFGVIDFSRAMYFSYVMHRLSREGANLATRGGMSFTQVRDTLVDSGKPLDMPCNGDIYIFQITKRIGSGEVLITGSGPGPGRCEDKDRSPRVPSILGPSPVVGETLSRAQLDRVLNDGQLLPGEVIVLVETYYTFSSITPVGQMFGVFPSGSMYMGSKAVFYLTPIDRLD